jgi:zinc protease
LRERWLVELTGMRDRPVTREELHGARDFLVGVFPLRFETPPAVVGAISSIVIHGLPDDELANYRAGIEAVTAEAITAAAQAHIRPDEASILLVGDASAFLPALEAANLGEITVEREPVDGGAVDQPA